MELEISTRKFQEIFAGDSEMAHLMRNHDWENSRMGPVTNWPQSLKTMIRVMLNSSYPMWVWWGKCMTMFHNDAYVPILGKRHPDALGKSGKDVWSEVWHLIGPMLEAVLNEGKSTLCVDQFLMLERNEFREESYITFSYDPVPDDLGNIGGIFCACTENTNKILSERRLRTLADLSGAANKQDSLEAIFDVTLKTLETNSRDLPVVAYVPISEGQLDWSLALSYGIADRDSSFSELALRTSEFDGKEPLKIQGLDQFLSFETKLEDLDCPREGFLFPVNSGDQSLGAILFALSPHRNLDDDYFRFLRLVLGQLEAAIGIQKTQERMRKEAEDLARLDREKTDFFANVSHEFRTPLTLMMGPLNEALEKDDGRSRELLSIAQRNCFRLQKLVNQLLDFSRLETSRAICKREELDLAEFTADLAGNFRSAIENAGIRFVVDCPKLSRPAFVDKDMWEKIVFNLLSNALKFTYRGEISLRISESEGLIQLRVEDSGIGIAPGEIQNIFRRFYRVQSIRGRSHEGSGIGLSLTSGLVDLLGGKISVTSREDKGSVFTVLMPFGNPDDVGVQEGMAQSSDENKKAFLAEMRNWNDPNLKRAEEISSPEMGRDKPLILVVDDNRDMRAYLRHTLESSYDLLLAGDGREALNILESHDPVLIISDVMMPEVDGMELLRTIRGDERLKSIPLLLLSARVDKESALQGIAEGADDYLTKPFEARELLTKVHSQIKLNEVRKTSAQEEAILHAEIEASQSSNRLKDEFLATVAHELRTPLNGIYGAIQLLRSIGPANLDYPLYIDTLEAAAVDEIRVVEDLIDISEVISGRATLHSTRFNLNSVIQSVISTIQKRYEPNAFDINLSVENFLFVEGDEKKIQKAIEKIVDNAVKFSDKRGNIDIKLLVEGDRACLSVSDHGRGISKGFLPHAFDSFRQENGDLSRKYGGLGIGLSLAKQIILAHSGSIELASEGEGKGVDCIVRLPLSKSKGKSDAPSALMKELTTTSPGVVTLSLQ